MELFERLEQELSFAMSLDLKEIFFGLVTLVESRFQLVTPANADRTHGTLKRVDSPDRTACRWVYCCRKKWHEGRVVSGQ